MNQQPWWQNSTTVTTLLAGVVAVTFGACDAAWLHLFDRQADVTLVGLGLGALIGHNPIAALPVLAGRVSSDITVPSVTPTDSGGKKTSA